MKELVSWDDEPEALAEKLTAGGLNVEGIERYEQTFPGVVIARVVHREQHPNADRLSLCLVDVGPGEDVQVVCGAPNVREGLTVLFAQVGAVLPGDFKLKQTKIRGIESRGMILAATDDVVVKRLAEEILPQRGERFPVPLVLIENCSAASVAA